MHLYAGTGVAGQKPSAPPAPAPAAEPARPAGPLAVEPVVITGAALGLPGTEKVFDDDNVARILAGQNFISVLGDDVRQRMVDMRITRLVKDAATGGGSFATIDNPKDVIKLAGVLAPLDVVEQFGVDKARDEALDTTTRLASSPASSSERRRSRLPNQADTSSPSGCCTGCRTSSIRV